MTNEELKEIETLMASDEFFIQESGASVIRDLLQEIADMRASQEEKNNTYHCSYCLTVSHDPLEMAEHIKTCESHPLSAARARITELDAEIERLKAERLKPIDACIKAFDCYILLLEPKAVIDILKSERQRWETK